MKKFNWSHPTPMPKQKFDNTQHEYEFLKKQHQQIKDDWNQPMLYRYWRMIIETPFWFDIWWEAIAQSKIATEAYKKKRKEEWAEYKQRLWFQWYLPNDRQMKIWIHKELWIPLKNINLN